MTTQRGPAITVGDVRVTPEAQVVDVQLLFGGFAWQRPVAVLVEREGRVERLRVADVTRIIQIALWACALLAWLILALRHRS